MAKPQTRPQNRPPAKKGSAKGAPVNPRQAKLDAARKARSTGPNKIVIGTVVAVIAIVAVVAGVIVNSESNKSKVNQGGKALPAGVSAMGAGWVANQGVTLTSRAPTVSVFEDFRCPVCKTLEGAFGDTIEQAATAGKIKVVFHFKTVIDGNLGSDNSQTAASNALCAADQGAFWKYHDALYANQPKEGTLFTKADFTTYAEQAGINGAKLTAFQACVDAGKYMNYVKSTEDASFKAGISGTPAFYINGQSVKWQAFAGAEGQPDTAAFEKAITTGTLTAAQKDTSLPKVSD